MKVSNDSTNHPITDANIDNALHDERVEIMNSRTIPKWSVQTLSDSKLDAFLSSHTRSSSHETSYAIDCYALTI